MNSSKLNRKNSSILNYEQSLMFGQYREDLANFALTQSEKLAQLKTERQQCQTLSIDSSLLQFIRRLFKRGDDMIFFAVLAITLAILSFAIDILTHAFFNLRFYLTTKLTDVFIYNYAIWIAFITIMVLISAIIVRFLSPQAAGSGVSEMKVVLRGVILKEYLSFKTLVAKIAGLIFTLGSGLPLGREGPFVHISAIAANQFMKLFSTISNPDEYESRFSEVIAVACGLGVAVTFASPVGGVLYSIEIVSVFFSVRSYWQGFFAAAVGALFWRLLTVWFHFEESITHIFKTEFRLKNPYETLEIISFALLGVICGLASCLFVAIHRNIVLFNRKKTKLNKILQKYPLLYPIFISIIIGLVSFPNVFGQFYGSWLSSDESIHELFSNYSWNTIQNYVDHDEIIDNWRTKYTSIFVNTFLFFVMNLVLVAVCCTLPIPSGVIVPSFKIGAGLGRFYGECMSYFFPAGINPFHNRTNYPILAGTYAVAGSAAFAGANTGALSSAVIAFEMTGQLTHLLPVIVAILTATITARRIGPSFYDSLIILKKLPYLPSILPSSSSGHRIFVEDFMERNLLFVYEMSTYRYIRHLLNSKNKLKIYPYVKSPDNMILLGTVQRSELQFLLDNHLNRKRMIHDIRQSMQNLNSQSSSTCPVHGQQPRFKVNTISENDEIKVNPIGVVAWEEVQLDEVVNFANCPIDPAPFQFMEGTSLLKVHNLFSLLGLQLAYVTSLGTLVGVVSLKQLRKAIEEMNSGMLPKSRNKSQQILNIEKYAEKDEEEEEEEDVPYKD